MPRLELHSFDTGFLDEAAHLLSRRHAAQRTVEPSLPAAYEQPAVARVAIEELLDADGSGSVATRGAEAVGYVLGTSRPSPIWGPNVWVEPAGHASTEPEAIRDLYGFAATRWVEEGRTSHYAVVPATDPAAVDAWFRLGFGHQHIHALREVPAGVAATPPAGIVVRPATVRDIEPLAVLDPLLPLHQRLSPCFATGVDVPTREEARADWVETLADEASGTFVAEIDGRVVGSALGCPVERSSGHSGLARPEGAALLAFAAVAPDARGAGIGQALGRAVLAWARSQGCEIIVTDWRMTNLLSSRAWLRAGYRPTFLRLFRAIV